MPPPVVTSTTGVLPPAPSYPPLPLVPQAPRPGIQPPGPDLQLMVPDAIPKVDKLNKLLVDEGRIEPAFPEAPVEFEMGNEWKLNKLFTLVNFTATPTSKSWPPSDPFTLFVMATLCRFAYYSGTSRFVEMARSSIIGALDGVTITRIGNPLKPWAQYDIYRTDAGLKIIVIQGTTSLHEWVSYAVRALVPLPKMGTAGRAYSGIAVQSAFYDALIAAPETGVGPESAPVVMAGHSLGGALAQILGASENVKFKAAQPGFGPPVRSIYTFGAPAFLERGLTDLPTQTTDLTCRVYLEGDPVPYATQASMASAAGIKEQLWTVAPGYFTAPESTAHYANKSVALVPLPVPERTSLRTAAMRGLAQGGNELLKRLVDQHQMRSYCRAAYEFAAQSPQSPAGKLASLQVANNALDLADAGTQ